MVPRSQAEPDGVAHKPVVTPAGTADAQQADATLVEQACWGERAARQAAFAVLVTRYEGFVRAMLYRLCGNAAEADDLAQEAFLTAWLKLHTLSSAASFRGWLKQLAYRQFLHGYRRRKVERKHADTVRDEAAVEMHTDDDLAPLLALCTPLERELMVLCYGFEFTYAEIGGARNMAVGTVKSHVHRAKGKIKAFLEQEESTLSRGNTHG